MKKHIIIWLSVVLLVCHLCCPAVLAATGTLSVSASATSVVVGNKLTVTVTYNGNNNQIAAIDSVINYDAKILNLESTSGADGVSIHGDAGVTRAIFEMPSSGVLPTSVSFKLVFKVLTPGACDIKVSTGEFVSNDSAYSSLGAPAKTLSISANNPTLSGDATLSYLRPSKGTLTPKFDKNVTEYTVSVPYTVTRGLLNYSATDPNATTDITNNADLKVGKNTRVITVTAPNGTVKKYTVVITREAQQSTTPPSSGTGGTTTTTLPQPAEDALEVSVNGVEMVIADTRPSVQLPENYAWDTTEVNGLEIPAAKQAASGLTLLYLTKKDSSEAGAFYIYNAQTDTFFPFCQIKGVGLAYTVQDLPSTETGPAGTIPGTFTLEGQSVAAYVYEDPALADYVLLYLTSPTGQTGLYTYDKVDGTVQRYHAVTVPEEDTPVVTPEPQVEPNPFVAFITQHKGVILTVAAACCGLALLVTAVVLAIRLIPTDGKGKH